MSKITTPTRTYATRTGVAPGGWKVKTAHGRLESATWRPEAGRGGMTDLGRRRVPNPRVSSPSCRGAGPQNPKLSQGQVAKYDFIISCGIFGF